MTDTSAHALEGREAERKAFEDWARANGYAMFTFRNTGAYEDAFTRHSFQAWLARADLPPPRPDPDLNDLREENAEDDKTVRQLRALATAYPEHIFREPSDEQIASLHAQHPGLSDRIAAAMGRHLGQFFGQAADRIEALEAELASLRATFERGEGRVEVKALEWRWECHPQSRSNVASFWNGYGPFGCFCSIGRFILGSGTAQRDVWLVPDCSTEFGTAEEAKDAAQADFRTRILSTIATGAGEKL